MKLNDLKNWDKLTKEEKTRLRWAYSSSPQVTKTMHDTTKKSLKKAAKLNE
jgi:hypothetical protein